MSVQRTKTGDYEVFLRQFLHHRNQIYTFLFALVGNPSDTEDIFQEVSTIMWRRFDQFEAGTNFLAWSRQIGRNVVMDYRRKRKRRQMVPLDDGIVDLLSQRFELIQDQVEDRKQSLKICLTKLNQENRHLIQMVYEQEIPIKSIANQMNLSVQRIYQKLGAVHGALLHCVERSLSIRGV